MRFDLEPADLETMIWKLRHVIWKVCVGNHPAGAQMPRNPTPPQPTGPAYLAQHRSIQSQKLTTLPGGESADSQKKTQIVPPLNMNVWSLILEP